MKPADKTIVLLPGEHFAGDEHYRVSTLLGSCVSIVLWQPQRRLGAMSHFVLADGPSPSPDRALNGRYGNEALALMLDNLRALGVAPGDCQAKVFGGGAMFGNNPQVLLPDVGRKNGEAARELLQRHGIPIVSESLFGGGHRQIIFSIRTGEVWMRHGGQGDRRSA
ncbi:chemotaxis protein CheD [Roseateles sp. BYS78W]|uniref:Probable chemoreceptor glutamine deamidase CheD n=1 Tax=Pelomonas candidula TaxID=3299025 RepID=A0ABW7HFL7_9BURK